MRKVLILTCLLAVAQQVAPQCAVVLFAETFVPECAPNDIFIKWPHYGNPAFHYACHGIGFAVLIPCPANQFFTFVMQACTSCEEYIPPVDCRHLKTQNPPNCVPIDGSAGNTTGGTVATTATTSTGTTSNVTATTITPTPTPTITPTPTDIPTTPSAATPPSPPTPPGPTTGTMPPEPTPPTIVTGAPDTTFDIPPPPSPGSTDTDFPQPPSPEPTPPGVPGTPPNIPTPPVLG